MLIAATAGICLTACQPDNEDNAVSIQIQTEIKSEEFIPPTYDLLLVTVTDDIPTAVFSQFDEASMGAALLRRLSNTTTSIEPNTKLLLVKGSDLLSLSDEQWDDLGRFYVNDGYIALEKPNAGDMLLFLLKLIDTLFKAELENLTKDGDINVYAETPEAARQVKSAHEEQLKVRYENMKARTRSAIDEFGAPLGELIIINDDSYYLCEAFEENSAMHSIIDEAGNETSQPLNAAPQQYSSYLSGLMADGAAAWLNSRDESLEQRAAETRRLMSRAAANDCINDLMSASDEFTYQKKLSARDNDGGSRYKQNAFHETITTWGVHNTKQKKDYYYVQQKVRMEVGGKQSGSARWNADITLYQGSYEPDMWITGNSYVYDGTKYEYYYGSWLSKYLSRLNLTGAGNIRVEKAIPHTDNNNVSESIAIGESHSETNTIGFSLGGSFGSKGASFNPSFNYSHGWTDGTSFTMTTTSNAKEMKCVKNTKGSEVTWTYEIGKKIEPYKDNHNSWCHPMAPDALTNDVDIENQICWSVENPKDSYDLSIYEQPYMSALMQVKGKGDYLSMRSWMTYEKKFTLKTPNRAVQEWYMDITFPEIGQEGHHGDKGKLVEYLQRQFPDIYQTRQSLADQTETSENTIKYLVDYSKSILLNSDGAQTMRDYALDLGLSQYTIKWYTIDNKHNTYELTIKAR